MTAAFTLPKMRARLGVERHRVKFALYR